MMTGIAAMILATVWLLTADVGLLLRPTRAYCVVKKLLQHLTCGSCRIVM